MSIVETTAGFYCTDCGQHLGLGACSGHVCSAPPAYCGHPMTAPRECGVCLAQSRAEVEQLRMQLAACGVAAMCNTPETVAQRITRDSPYWSASYGDVCAAVDREMLLRGKLAEAREALAAVEPALVSYARDNPLWRENGGATQDPSGVHAALELLRAALGEGEGGREAGREADTANLAPNR